MASINSSDQRLSTSKRRLKPLMLRDYLLDDLSSCSSNGFKSFPRRQPKSTSVRRLLDAEIKRYHKPRLTRNRTTCGTAITHAVQKASTAFLHAVKLLPFPSSPSSRKGDNNKQGIFSRSFSKRVLSKSFWRKSIGNSRREIEICDGEIQWWRSAAFFPDFITLDQIDQQPSDLISHLSIDEQTRTFSVISAAEATNKDSISGDSSSFGSEVFTNSEVVQSSSSFSSSGESSEEVSNENDGVESGESIESHDCDGSSVNRNSLCRNHTTKECENEEKEQLSPVSILECPFQDDEDDDDEIIHISQENDEKLTRTSKRFKNLVRLEPLELGKRIDKYVERQENSDEESENRANHLFDLIKSKIGETNKLLASRLADNLLLDYLQEENGLKDERLMMKKVEEWVMEKQEDMFMSWEVKEKREVYVKEMKWDWDSINGDERENVIEELGNEFFTSLMDELIIDFS